MGNLVVNPSFEIDTSNWNLDADFTRSNQDSKEGDFSIKQVSITDFNSFRSAGIAVLANTYYRLSFWIKCTSLAGEGVRIQVNYTDEYNGHIIDSANPKITANSLWERREIVFFSGSNTTIWLRFFNSNGACTAYWDKFYLDITRELVSNPSFDFDLSGWDMEAAYTRVSSDSFDSGFSIKFDGSSFDNFTTAGGNYKIELKPNTDYVFSIWAKIPNAAGYPHVQLNTGSEYGTNMQEITLDDTLGAWKRYKISFNSGSNPDLYFRIFNGNIPLVCYFDRFSVMLARDYVTSSLLPISRPDIR